MSNVTPCAFLSLFLVRIPKKEIGSIFGNRDDIGHKHKKGFMDYQSIKITTKSKSISIHHGFRQFFHTSARKIDVKGEPVVLVECQRSTSPSVTKE